MKKSLLTLITAFLCSLTALAQIPNNSFENWTTVGTYEVPNGWGTLNHSTAIGSVFTVTKATPGNPGNFYMKITSKTIGTAVVGGIAVSGKLDSINMKAKSGFPYTGQPVSFTGRWQHMIYGTSQGSLKATLTKWNSALSKRDTIATASHTLSGMAMSWANFTINFAYKSSNLPDSCIIELRSSGSNPTNNDYLWVDNLAFNGTAAGINTVTSEFATVALYPNPASQQVELVMNLNSQQTVNVQVIDLTGKTLLTKSYNDVIGEVNQKLDISDLSAGTYFVKISSEKGNTVKKLIVK